MKKIHQSFTDKELVTALPTGLFTSVPTPDDINQLKKLLNKIDISPEDEDGKDEEDAGAGEQEEEFEIPNLEPKQTPHTPKNNRERIKSPRKREELQSPPAAEVKKNRSCKESKAEPSSDAAADEGYVGHWPTQATCGSRMEAQLRTLHEHPNEEEVSEHEPEHEHEAGGDDKPGSSVDSEARRKRLAARLGTLELSPEKSKTGYQALDVASDMKKLE